MTPRATLIAAALVALAQIGFLGFTILSRAAVLRDGREVLVKVEPVDPRDLLRGDYVRLGYDMARIPPDLIAGDARKAENGQSVTVRLARQGDGVWLPVQASLDAPFAAPPSADQVDIRGVVESAPPVDGTGVPLRVEYGVERFYLPEGEGKAIEHDMRERPFFVKLAVATDGTVQIKQFLDGDKLLYAEPLY